MTKKDYVAIAKAIQTARDSWDVPNAQGERNGIGYAAEALCPVFKADNDCFDRDRFLRACGL